MDVHVDKKFATDTYLNLLSDALVKCCVQYLQVFLHACVQTTNRAKEMNRWRQEITEMGGLKDIQVDTWTNERREMKRMMRRGNNDERSG